MHEHLLPCLRHVCPDQPLLGLLTSSQEFMPLASFQWRLSFLSITRSVLHCHGNISDTVNQQMNERLKPLCVPPTCLDQLKCVSHLPMAVLLYRVSLNTFFRFCINRRVLTQLELFQIFVSSSPTAQQGANTLITDLCSGASFFSPSLTLSSSHQLSYFRDELFLFIYLYQRW